MAAVGRDGVTRAVRVRLCALALAWAAAGSCSGGDPATRYLDDPEALARGRAVFVGTCSGYCHAEGMQIGDAPDLFDCEWRYGGSNPEIFTTISSGVPGSRMVGFAGRLPEGDDDIWKVVAYLRSRGGGC